jgi:hypothetical protein
VRGGFKLRGGKLGFYLLRWEEQEMVEKMNKKKKEKEKIFQPAFQGRKETIDVDVTLVGISTLPTTPPQCFADSALSPSPSFLSSQ